MSYDHKDLVQSESKSILLDAGFEWDDLTRSYRRPTPRPLPLRTPDPAPRYEKPKAHTYYELNGKAVVFILVLSFLLVAGIYGLIHDA